MIFAQTCLLAIISITMMHRHVGLVPAFTLVVLKYSIPLLYFLFYFDGILANDDGKYYLNSLLIKNKFGCGFGLIPSLDLFSYATYLSEGIHFGYAYVSSIMLCVFGSDYSSPVLFNVFISTLISINMLKIVRYLDVKVSPFLVLVVFLHPDIIAWSSYLNLKDTIVAWLISAILLRVCAQVLAKEEPGYGALFIFAIILVTFRYYAVPVVLFIIMISFLLSEGKKNYALLVVFSATFLFVLFEFKVTSIVWSLINQSSPSTLFNLIRFLLGPLPFQLTPDYSFLLIGSLFHLISVPAAIIGACYLFKINRKIFSVLLCFAFILSSFYALFPDLLGPRQRYQMITVYGLFQVLGLSNILACVFQNRRHVNVSLRKN